jgi:integration host factor subunit beta
MNRPDLVDRIKPHFIGLNATDVEASVATILSAIGAKLAGGGRVEIRDFGVFYLNHRPPRTGRNPNTGAAVAVPAKHSPHFKPGKALRQRVDRAVNGKKTRGEAKLMQQEEVERVA